jgi:hypothetical protein
MNSRSLEIAAKSVRGWSAFRNVRVCSSGMLLVCQRLVSQSLSELIVPVLCFIVGLEASKEDVNRRHVGFLYNQTITINAQR